MWKRKRDWERASWIVISTHWKLCLSTNTSESGKMYRMWTINLHFLFLRDLKVCDGVVAASSLYLQIMSTLLSTICNTCVLDFFLSTCSTLQAAIDLHLFPCLKIRCPYLETVCWSTVPSRAQLALSDEKQATPSLATPITSQPVLIHTIYMSIGC